MQLKSNFFSGPEGPIKVRFSQPSGAAAVILDDDLAIYGMSEPAQKQVWRMAAAARSVAGYDGPYDPRRDSDAKATLQQLRDLYDDINDGQPLKMLFWCLADAMDAVGPEKEAEAWADVSDALETLIKDLGGE